MNEKRILTSSGREPDEELFILRNAAEIRTGATIGLFALALLFALYVAKPVLLPIMLALLLNFILRPIHRVLTRLRIHRVAAAAIILAFFFGLLGLGAVFLTDPAIAWVERMPRSVNVMEEKMRNLTEAFREVSEVADRVDDLTAINEDAGVPDVEVRESGFGVRALATLQQVMVYVFLSSILLFFMLAYGEHIFRRVSIQHAWRTMVEEINSSISTYLLTITVINALLGVAVGFAMFALGMPNSILWGFMAGFFNFVPYLGAIVGILIIAVVAILTFDNTTYIVLVPTVYFALTALEGNFITPMVLGRRFTLNPIVILIWLIFWSWVWGVSGGLIAVPLLMAFKILCDHVRPLQPLSRLMTMDREEDTLIPHPDIPTE